ncbi:hypothetical protein BDU57DRAFT_467650 [Ampelomyces quisqualis]|uniref:Uncharacterized protein n=1 Tax=Ampelomyces quisqualis TaxID=50730 RepID=A0A6A5R3Q6_AMPQU|nr:hypothetical protein BDU57DRAFT_467650 [Ampelomyces quisqualis]
MAATRLRRTFHYPTESDDEDAVEQGMDEQDQETLISTLSAHDTSSTRTYTLLLSALPLAPALLSLPLLLRLSTFAQSVLAITSFLASAYTLYFLPLPPQTIRVVESSDIKGNANRKVGNGGGYAWNTPAQSSTVATLGRPSVPFLSDGGADLLARYIVAANGGVCAVLALLELWQGRSWSEGVMVGGGYLPGFVLSVVMWARRELRVVDLGELEKLKYRSKGI